MGGFFSEGKNFFEPFIHDLLSMSINLLQALYLVFPRYLFNMGPAFKISRDVETLTIDGYLTLILLTLENLALHHHLMICVQPVAMPKVHPRLETYL